MEISLSLQLMFLVFVCFIILYFFLNHWLYRPILNFMSDREKALSNMDLNVKNDVEEIEKIEGEISKILSKAQLKANSIIDKASAKAKLTSQEHIEQAQISIESKMKDFHKQLEKDKKVLKDSLSKDVAIYKKNIKRKLENV